MKGRCIRCGHGTVFHNKHYIEGTYGSKYIKTACEVAFCSCRLPYPPPLHIKGVVL